MLFSFFQFMVNSEQSGSRIPDGYSAKLTFSIIVIFYPAKTENRPKNLQHNSHTIALSKGTVFTRKCCFLQQQQKNADNSKIKKALVLKAIFSETSYVCVLLE